MTGAEVLMNKGKLVGRQEGYLESERTSLIEFLEARFGTVSPALRTSILAECDSARFRQLRRLAATCSSLAEFSNQAAQR